MKAKTHLFIFITPHILRDEAFEDLTGISSDVEVQMKDIKDGDWRDEVGLWKVEKSEPEVAVQPEIISLDVKTVVKEEKYAGNEGDTVEAGGKRDRRRR